MSKITSKIKFLDENRLSFKIENGMLCVLDQNEKVIGERPLPIPIDADNMDVEEIYQKAEDCGYNIDDMISEIIQTSVIENKEYDVWLSQDLFIFFSPTKSEWVSEPCEGVFGIIRDMYEEEMKEIEMGADEPETENLDCPIEDNDSTLVPKRDPNFEYGDEEEMEENEEDEQVLSMFEELAVEEEPIVEHSPVVEEVEDEIEPENTEEPTVEESEETPVVETEEPVVEETKEEPVLLKKEDVQPKVEVPVVEKKQPQPEQPKKKEEHNKPNEIKKENKPEQSNKGNNQNSNQQKQPQKQPNQNVAQNQKNEKEKVNNMSQQNNQQNSTKAFTWNDKAKTLRSAVDELIKYKNETKSNEIGDCAKSVVALIEEKHMDPNSADEKEILYNLALNGKTIVKGLTPIRAGIYKSMLQKELRSLGF